MEEEPGVHSIMSVNSANGVTLITQIEIDNVTNEFEYSETNHNAEDAWKEQEGNHDQSPTCPTDCLQNTSLQKETSKKIESPIKSKEVPKKQAEKVCQSPTDALQNSHTSLVQETANKIELPIKEMEITEKLAEEEDQCSNKLSESSKNSCALLPNELETSLKRSNEMPEKQAEKGGQSPKKSIESSEKTNISQQNAELNKLQSPIIASKDMPEKQAEKGGQSPKKSIESSEKTHSAQQKVEPNKLQSPIIASKDMPEKQAGKGGQSPKKSIESSEKTHISQQNAEPNKLQSPIIASKDMPEKQAEKGGQSPKKSIESSEKTHSAQQKVEPNKLQSPIIASKDMPEKQAEKGGQSPKISIESSDKTHISQQKAEPSKLQSPTIASKDVPEKQAEKGGQSPKKSIESSEKTNISQQNAEPNKLQSPIIASKDMPEKQAEKGGQSPKKSIESSEKTHSSQQKVEPNKLQSPIISSKDVPELQAEKGGQSLKKSIESSENTHISQQKAELNKLQSPIIASKDVAEKEMEIEDQQSNKSVETVIINCTLLKNDNPNKVESSEKNKNTENKVEEDEHYPNKSLKSLKNSITSPQKEKPNIIELPFHNEDMVVKPLVNGYETAQKINGLVEAVVSSKTTEVSPNNISTPIIENCEKDLDKLNNALNMSMDIDGNEVIEVLQIQVESVKESNGDEILSEDSSSGQNIAIYNTEEALMQDAEDSVTQDSEESRGKVLPSTQKTVRTSREMKSLIKSAKESKIINECTQLTTKKRQSKGPGTNGSLNKSVDSAMPARRGSTNSQVSNTSGRSDKTKRSMRSQNPDFVSKQKLFLNSVTGKLGKDSENKLNSNDVPTPLAEISIEIVTKESPKKSPRKKHKLADVSKIRSDAFCWQCHWTTDPDPEQTRTDKSSDKPPVHCTVCPRSFHYKCLNSNERARVATEGTKWACPECTVIVNVENSVKRSMTMKDVTLGKLCELLQYAWNQITAINGTEPFMDPVDRTQFPDYDNYVVNPMCLNQIKKNIANKVYGSTEAFLSDIQWLVHNSIIYNAAQSKLTVVARAIARASRVEMLEIETCPECYAGAHARSFTFFTDVCSNPHILLWAKLKGFPYWPAKGMSVNSLGQIDVRFFGAHDRARVPAKDCYLYSVKDPNNFRTKRLDILDSMQEAEEHIRNLAKKYGRFKHAPFQTKFDPMKWNEQLLSMIPDFNGDISFPRTIDKLTNSSSPATFKTKPNKKGNQEVESEASGDESSRSGSVVTESNESHNRPLRRKLPMKEADIEIKVKRRRISLFREPSVARSTMKRRSSVFQEPSAKANARRGESVCPEPNTTSPESTSNVVTRRKRAMSMFVEDPNEMLQNKSKKQRESLLENADVTLRIRSVRKAKPPTEPPPNTNTPVKTRAHNELCNEITQSLSEIPEFIIRKKSLESCSPKSISTKKDTSNTQEISATSTSKPTENSATIASFESPKTPLPETTDKSTISIPTQTSEDTTNTSISTPTEKNNKNSEPKVKPIKLVRNAFNRKSLSIKHDSEMDIVDSNKKDTSETKDENTTKNKSVKTNSKKKKDNKNIQIAIANVGGNDINTTNMNVLKISTEGKERENGPSKPQFLLVTSGSQTILKAADSLEGTSEANGVTIHNIKYIPGFPKVTQVRSLCKTTAPSVVVKPTTSLSKIVKKSPKPKSSQNTFEKVKSNATENKDAPVQKVNKDATVQKVNKDAPVQKVNKDATVQKVNKDAPVQKVNKDATVQKVNKDVTVQKVNKDAPVQKVNKDAPVQRVVGRVGVRSFARIQKSPEPVSITPSTEVVVKKEPVDMDEVDHISHLQGHRMRPVLDESGKQVHPIPGNSNASEPPKSVESTPPMKPTPAAKTTVPIKIMPTMRHQGPSAHIRPVRVNAPQPIFGHPIARARMPMPASISTSVTSTMAPTLVTPHIGMSAPRGALPSVRMPVITSVNGQWTLAIGQPFAVADTNAVIMNGIVSHNNINNNIHNNINCNNSNIIIERSTNVHENALRASTSTPEKSQSQKMINLNPLDPATPLTTVPAQPSSGPLTAKLNHNVHKLTDFFRELLTDCIEKCDVPASALTYYKLQMEQMRWQHQQEITDLKKDHVAAISDMRKSSQSEKLRLIKEIRRKCQNDLEQAVLNTKTKQWCSYCFKESNIYCCWNTSYCEEACQRMHWTDHNKHCLGNRLMQTPAPKTVAEMRHKSVPKFENDKCSIPQIVSVPTNTPSTSTIVSTGPTLNVTQSGGYLIVGATSASTINNLN